MITRFIPLLLALALLTSTAAQAVRPGAQAAAAAAPAATPAPDQKPPPYVLKNKSTYGSYTDDQQRAPFWPIGWTKRKPVSGVIAATQPVVAPKVVFDEKSVRLTSILLGNPSLAIINGRTYSEGEFLRVPKVAATAGAPGAAGSVPSRVRVYRINDGNVTLQNQDQLITVALQRPELIQRSSGGDLLTEDRP